MKYRTFGWSSFLLIRLYSGAERDDMTIASVVLPKVEQECGPQYLHALTFNSIKRSSGRACRPRPLKKTAIFHSYVSFPMGIDKDYIRLTRIVCVHVRELGDSFQRQTLFGTAKPIHHLVDQSGVEISIWCSERALWKQLWVARLDAELDVQVESVASTGLIGSREAFANRGRLLRHSRFEPWFPTANLFSQRRLFDCLSHSVLERHEERLYTWSSIALSQLLVVFVLHRNTSSKYKVWEN